MVVLRGGLPSRHDRRRCQIPRWFGKCSLRYDAQFDINADRKATQYAGSLLQYRMANPNELLSRLTLKLPETPLSLLVLPPLQSESISAWLFQMREYIHVHIILPDDKTQLGVPVQIHAKPAESPPQPLTRYARPDQSHL